MQNAATCMTEDACTPLQGYRLGLPYFRAESVHSLNLRTTFSASVGGLVALILPLYYVFVRYSSGIEFE